MQGSNLGFGKEEDKKHLLEFTIPSDHFTDGTLFFELSIETERGGVETLSAGIDDFILETYYNCRGLSRRGLEGKGEANNNVTAAVTNNQDEDEPYCKADNFPCSSGENMVLVCHHSKLRGRKTLCIPEMNSRAIQNYVNDYCGPCVGHHFSVLEADV